MRILSLIFVITLSLSLNAGQPNIRVWGDNTYHQCDVPGDLTNAIAVSAGDNHVLALRPNGTVVAWGRDSEGQCDVPPGLTNAVAIYATWRRSAAITSEGRVVLWGDWSTFFDGTLVGSMTNVPPTATNVTALTSGAFHVLALRAGGDVIGWGYSPGGQLNIPADLTNAIAVCAEDETSTAVRADGTVAVWGWRSSAFSNIPADLTNALSIVTDGYHVLALKADGTLVSWGSSPFEIRAGLDHVVAISGLLALKSDGTVVAWSANSYGQTNVPTDLPFVSQISGGAIGISSINAALIDPNHAAAPPTILLQPTPANQTAAIGASASFRAQAGGFPPLTYQWYLGTNAVPGATNSVIYFASLQAAQSGSYTLAVSNPAGTTRSQPAILNVLPGLTINMVPAVSLTGTLGANYLIEYVDTIGPTEQWKSLATVTITNVPQYYFDVSGINQPRRFYRVVQVP